MSFLNREYIEDLERRMAPYLANIEASEHRRNERLRAWAQSVTLEELTAEILECFDDHEDRLRLLCWHLGLPEEMYA